MRALLVRCGPNEKKCLDCFAWRNSDRADPSFPERAHLVDIERKTREGTFSHFDPITDSCSYDL